MVELYIPSAQNTSSYSLASVRLENFFRSSDNDLRKLSPSREVLRKQTKGSFFQSGYLWSKPLRTFRYLTFPSGAGFLTKIRECLYNFGKVELVQLQSTNSRPLAVATRKSARLVNVKGLAAFPCVGVKRSLDLNRR